MVLGAEGGDCSVELGSFEVVQIWGGKDWMFSPAKGSGTS